MIFSIDVLTWRFYVNLKGISYLPQFSSISDALVKGMIVSTVGAF